MFIGGRPRKEQASPTETNDVNMDEQDEQITDNTKAPPPLQKRYFIYEFLFIQTI